MLTLTGHYAGKMVEAAQILIANENEVTGSTNLGIIPVTIQVGLEEHGVGATVRTDGYPYHNMGEARHADGVPDLVEKYIISNGAYGSNRRESEEDEKSMAERGEILDAE